MEANKRQVVFIRGGDAFRDEQKLHAYLRERTIDPAEEKKRWRDDIMEKLGDSYEFHTPDMPNPLWADYEAWKIWFEKYIPFLYDDVILVGHSLGGGFLLRYLSEEEMPVTVAQLHIVAGVVDNQDLEDVEGFTIDLTAWNGLLSTVKAAHLWYSCDDPHMLFNHGQRLAAAWPEATLHTFTDRGHFLDPEFPELLEVIKKCV